MKEIKAYIKAIKLDAVMQALHEVEGVDGASISEVRGFGRSKLHSERWKSANPPTELVHHVKVEVVCEDRLEDAIVDAIKRAAHTGLPGDGRIFSSDVSRSVRIQEG